MDVRFAVLADAASTDQAGKLSIFGIFDRIMVGRVPTAHHGARLVIMIDTTVEDAGRHKVEVLFIDEDGNLGFQLELSGDVGAPEDGSWSRSLRIIVPLPPIVVHHSGLYSFEIMVDGRYAAGVPLEVEVLGEE